MTKYRSFYRSSLLKRIGEILRTAVVVPAWFGPRKPNNSP